MYKYICECGIEHETYLYWHIEDKCKYCVCYLVNGNIQHHTRFRISNLSFFVDYIEQYITVQNPNIQWRIVSDISFIKLSSHEEYFLYFEKYMDNLIFL